MGSKANSDIALGDVRSTSYDPASANRDGYTGTIEDALAAIRAEDDTARPYWPLNVSRERYELLGFLRVGGPSAGPSLEMDQVNEDSYGVPGSAPGPSKFSLEYAQAHFPESFSNPDIIDSGSTLG